MMIYYKIYRFENQTKALFKKMVLCGKMNGLISDCHKLAEYFHTKKNQCNNVSCI